MTNIVILNGQTHRGLQIDVRASAALGDNQNFVPVVVSEFGVLALQYPILMSKNSETGAFYCGAMLGFDAGENLFLRQGGGHDGYRPLFMQRAPFLTAGRELAIDLDSPRINPPTEGRALFAETGEPTAYLESIFNAMRELTPGIERTKIFVDTLIDLRLVEPVDIKLAFDDGVNLELTGLYTINKSALHDLPDQKVVELFRRGYLNLIYLMIASISHVHSLAQKRNDRLLDATSSLT